MSMFNGLSGSPPALSSCWTASSVLTRPYAGVQAFFSRSKQISPVLKLTFGWQTGVRKRISGGSLGYDGGTEMVRAKRPPTTDSSVYSSLRSTYDIVFFYTFICRALRAVEDGGQLCEIIVASRLETGDCSRRVVLECL